MKAVAALILLLSLYSSFDAVQAARLDSHENSLRGINGVIKTLENLLEKSKTDGGSERELYSKFKCYCDEETAEKNKAVKDLTTATAQLANEIQELQGSTGVLSSEVGELKAKMDKNAEEREALNAIREQEEKDYKAFKSDSETATTQLEQALEILSAQDADQTLGASAADHKSFMGGHKMSLVSNRSMVSKKQAAMIRALSIVSSVLRPDQQKRIKALIQGPFTGTYTSQAVEVVGILKQMKDGFEEKLKEATAHETAAVQVHAKLIAIKTEESKLMKASFDGKQSTLATNDGEMGSKKGQLTEAKTQLSEAGTFLEKLTPTCEAKEKEFQMRKIFRSNEDMALSEAISILRSDSATFAKVAATKFFAKRHSNLLQMSSRQLLQRSDGRQAAEEALRSVAPQSPAAKQVLAMLQTGNPFSVVLKKIDDMMELIQKEAKVDKKQKEWCQGERKENGMAKKSKEDAISGLETTIDNLNKSISDPQTGYKASIVKTDDALKSNHEQKKSETKLRDEENAEYKEGVRDMDKAQKTISKAVAVLQEYYVTYHKEVISPSLAQKADPEPPSTWQTGSYKGQKYAGQTVIKTLEGIMDTTKKEELQAHDDESKAQHAYEDSMQDLMDEEAKLQAQLVKQQEMLAKAEKQLEQTYEDKYNTEKDKMAIENYLEDIKIGCDFAIGQFDIREAARKKETAALKFAKTNLEGTPSYVAAAVKAKHDAMGECKGKCVVDADHVDCKSCLAKVTASGYCAGHPSTKGC